MSVDWRLSQATRTLAEKRAMLEALDGFVQRLGVLLDEALGFDGEYRARLQSINSRLIDIGPCINSVTMHATRRPTEADLVETIHLEEERAALEQDVARARAARTTTVTDGLMSRSFCELDPLAVGEKRRRVMGGRNALAAEVAALEQTIQDLTQAEATPTAEPAASDTRSLVERLRQRIG